MLKEIKLPAIAANVEYATVLAILVSEGDTIEKEQSILEMESEKATFELPSDFEGVVKEIRVNEGDEVKVGQVVMTIETEEAGEKEEKGEQEDTEQQSQDAGHRIEKDKSTEKEESPKEEKEVQKPSKEIEEQPLREDQGQDEKEAEEPRGDKKQGEENDTSSQKAVIASPSVRRLARELGVAIHQVKASGEYDRITLEDVKSHAKGMVTKSDEPASISDDYQLPDFSSFGETERKPLDSIRQRIGKAMVSSWQNIPHVFHFDKADITNLEIFREQYSGELEKQGSRLTVTAILLKILAVALEKFPKFNASLDIENAEIVYKRYYHIGVAVDTDRGLLVPVIRDVNLKTISTLSKELGELAQKARDKKIKPDELQGGNIAISNLGGIGGTNFTPIVYRPNVAILGVSRSTTEAVFIDGEFKPRKILPLSVSYDHRIIDGAEAARFLRWLCEALENPLIMIF